jgi:membrane-associated phospholipid phosphatase
MLLGATGIYLQKNVDVKIKAQQKIQAAVPFLAIGADDYLQFAPVAAVYAYNLCKKTPINTMADKTWLLLKSEFLVISSVYLLKNYTYTLRPDSSSYNSFPSGHTAQAFVAASYMHHELGSKSIWYSVAGYAVATSVGLMRIANNRHWLSDVCLGAGMGILGTELVYATHQNKFFRHSKLSIVPLVGYKQAGFVVNF